MGIPVRVPDGSERKVRERERERERRREYVGVKTWNLILSWIFKSSLYADISYAYRALK